MKKMKLLSLLLALVMMLSVFMTGCNKEDKDDEGDKEPTVEEGVDPNLSLGVIKDYTYTNNYIGIGLALDSSWTMADAKELQDLPDEVEDKLNGTLLGSAMKNVNYYMDMQATKTSGTNVYTINVVMEKLSTAQKNLYKGKNDSQCIDITLTSKDAMIQAYEAIGMRDITMTKVDTGYLGETRTVLRTDSTLYGMPYTILQVLYFDLGEYSASITVACVGENSTAELLAMFEKI